MTLLFRFPTEPLHPVTRERARELFAKLKRDVMIAAKPQDRKHEARKIAGGKQF